MSYEFQPLSGGIDYVQPSEPTPEANASWAEISEDYNNISGFEQDWSHTHHDSYITSIKVVDGSVYSSQNSGTKVVSSNTSDGSINWSHNLHSDNVKSVTADSNYLYSGGYSKIIKVDRTDGSKIWETNVGQSYINDMVIHNDKIYLCSNKSNSTDNGVFAINTSDGSTVWSHSNHGDNLFGISYYNGVVYSCAYSGEVVAYDTSSNSKIWSHTLHTSDYGVATITVSSDAVYSGGGSGDPRMIAVDLLDGSKKWEYTLPDNPISFEYSNGNVYSGDYSSNLVVINGSDGSLISSNTLNTNQVRGLDVIDKSVYNGDASDNIFKFNIQGVDYWKLKVSDGTSWWGV